MRERGNPKARQTRSCNPTEGYVGLHFDPTTPSRLKPRRSSAQKALSESGPRQTPRRSSRTTTIRNLRTPRASTPNTACSALHMGAYGETTTARTLRQAYGQGSNLERSEDWNENCEDEAVTSRTRRAQLNRGGRDRVKRLVMARDSPRTPNHMSRQPVTDLNT